jgi:excisionase family DNA binding protein
MDSLTVSVEQAARLLGISRGLAYDLARQGKIPVVRAGQKRLLVSRVALEDFLAGKWQPAQAGVTADKGRER